MYKLTSLPLLKSGKVRDIYTINASRLLIVASDRVSAFDALLPVSIPRKGQMINTISKFWFNFFKDDLNTQATTDKVDDLPLTKVERVKIRNRAVIVKNVTPIRIEAIVRGYLVGSGWAAYQKTGKVCGITLKPGLRLAERLKSPIYTPSEKIDSGDINITYSKTVEMVGADLAHQIREYSLLLYSKAAKYALAKGIIIADVKFEFGLDHEGNLILIDELFTPDSARLWVKDTYQVGTTPDSYDKQHIRDYIASLEPDEMAKLRSLPADLITQTTKAYTTARDILTT